MSKSQLRAEFDVKKVHDWLTGNHNDRQISTILHGAASILEIEVCKWAGENGVAEKAFKTQKAKGRAAVPIRNAFIVRDGKPDKALQLHNHRSLGDLQLRRPS